MDNSEHSFSVIMTVYDQAQLLEQNLPAYLTQQHDGGYEVIVVDESSTDETEDVLKLLKQNHSCLYTTFLPKPNRRIVRRKMALSLGVKAAGQKWVIMTDIHVKPSADDLLQAIAAHLDGSEAITLGYVRGSTTRLQPFATIEEAHQLIRRRERIGRKQPRQHRRYMKGNYDFIITRKEQAHEVLKWFEERIGFWERLRMACSISCANILSKSATVKLTSE